jgi:hypothetical protein
VYCSGSMNAGVMSDPHGNRRWFWIASVGCALLVLCIARFGMDAGSTWDEPSRAQYGDLIVRWFASGFHDTSATRFENLYLEGGLFEVIAQLLARLSPLGVLETRHLLIAGVGLAGIVGTGLVASEVASRRAGILAGAILALTPAWIGHSWFNSKDIPFGTAAIFVTWFATRIAARGAAVRVTDILGTGIAIGIALAIRPGGYFLAVYPLCACLLGIATSNKRRDLPSILQAVRLTLLRFVPVMPVAWLLMLLAWPWAWSSPVVGPLVAMKFASRVPFTANTLFQGELIEASAAPASYLPTWFAITTPDYYFVAFTLGVVALTMRRRITEPVNTRGLAVISLAIALPIGAAMITKPAIYDGLRHFLFVFPPLAALAGVAVSSFMATEAVPRIARVVGVGILLIAAGATMFDIVMLHPYEYAYFNRSFGGLPAAAGRFETDYWGAAYKEGFAWVVNESHASATRPIRVASCNESSNKRLEYYRQDWPGASERVSIVPPEAGPDVFLESTRQYLCTHVDGPVIHTVSRSAVPLLYVRQTSLQP